MNIQQSPPKDPFSLDLRGIGSLLEFNLQETPGQRVKIEGIATLQRLGEWLIVQDKTGAISVRTSATEVIEPGTRVQVVGIPVLDRNVLVLQEVIFRRVPESDLLEPYGLTAREALRLENHFRLVCMTGRLLDRTVRPNEQVLVLQADNLIFPVMLEKGKAQNRFEHLREGSLLRITGVAFLTVSKDQPPSDFRVLVRSPADIVVLKQPGWWTLWHTLGVIVVLAGLSVAALSWVMLLRKRVQQKTELIRQRLEREAALEARYHELFENASDMVYTHDLEGNYTSVNKAGERLLGYQREEFLKLNVSQVVVPGHHAVSRQMLERKLSEGGQTTYELQVIAKDGGRLTMEISSRLILENGAATGVHGVARDITERKRAERLGAAFSDLGHQLSSARRPEAAAHIIVEIADQLLGWDACYLHVFTQDHQAIIPVMNFDLIDGKRVAASSAYVDMIASPMDLMVAREGQKLILREGPFPQTPGLIPFGDKHRPSASLMYVPMRNGPIVIGILSIQSYIPQAYDQADLETLQALADHCAGALERIRAEEALRQSEERFSKAFQATPVAVAILHQAHGKLLDANDSFLQIFGFGRREVTGCTATELGLWDKPEDGSQLNSLLSTHRSLRNLEWRFRTKSGEGRETLLSVEAIELGNEPCLLLIIHDLTERLHLETQLRHAQKMEAVGQLAAGVAHDFNNIMTIIQVHTSLLLSNSGLDAEMGESLKEVSVAAERATNLTRQLLAFSRKQIMEVKSLDLNQVIWNMAKMLQRLLGAEIILECDCEPSLPFICGDASLMEQIIVNLAVNARDAMPQGGRLMISTSIRNIDGAAAQLHPEARVGRFICLRVADTGCGMDSFTLSKVFEPFFTTKDVGQGTGLGLSMVYGIMKQHQGWIEVASEPGQGTAFKLFLPTGQTAYGTSPRPSPALGLLSGTERILVVEDEPALRELVSQLLRRQGYAVLEAGSGKEALKLWEQRGCEIDLVLTDIKTDFSRGEFI